MEDIKKCFQCNRNIESIRIDELIISGVPFNITGTLGSPEVKIKVRNAFNNMGHQEGEKHLCGFCYHNVDNIIENQLK